MNPVFILFFPLLFYFVVAKSGFFNQKPITPEQMSSAKLLVDGQISSSPNVVYSKTYCPYCTRAKNELDKLGVKYTLVELNVDSNGSAIQSYLAELTGQRTVPNIFLGNKHIGGCDDLMSLIKSGKINDYIKV
ncbi:hypothetical protein BB560_003411 [Smittium megazygosporum]|uniref:Glutaredoxin domain-containing protein n=1 Tax=Smittium megazygosporum TaxID=133381 RepID=A0A2T9ZC18_9FUNG|nr:hypothetical protein BB560_003411 [Smittium megazygosporum]